MPKSKYHSLLQFKPFCRRTKETHSLRTLRPRTPFFKSSLNMVSTLSALCGGSWCMTPRNNVRVLLSRANPACYVQVYDVLWPGIIEVSGNPAIHPGRRELLKCQLLVASFPVLMYCRWSLDFSSARARSPDFPALKQYESIVTSYCTAITFSIQQGIFEGIGSGFLALSDSGPMGQLRDCLLCTAAVTVDLDHLRPYQQNSPNFRQLMRAA